MGLTTVTPVVITGLWETRERHSLAAWVRLLMHFECVRSQDLERRATDPGGRAGEAAINDRVVQTQRFKDLSTLVGLERRNTHLRHDLEDTVVCRIAPVGSELIRRLVDLGETFTVHLHDRFLSEPWADSISAVSKKHTDVVHLTGFGRLNHKCDAVASLLADKVVVNTTTGNKRADRDAIRANVAV